MICKKNWSYEIKLTSKENNQIDQLDLIKAESTQKINFIAQWKINRTLNTIII